MSTYSRHILNINIFSIASIVNEIRKIGQIGKCPVYGKQMELAKTKDLFTLQNYTWKRDRKTYISFFFCLLKFILHAAISNILLYIKFANFAWDLQLHIHAYKIKYVN